MDEEQACNFYCHQCNSRIRLIPDELSCSLCGSGFIEELVDDGSGPHQEDESPSNSTIDHSEHGLDTHENFDTGSMLGQMLSQTLGSSFRNDGDGRRNGITIIRAGRRGDDANDGDAATSDSDAHRGSFGSAGIFGDPFIRSLIRNLGGEQEPGQFHIFTDGGSGSSSFGSSFLHGNAGDYAWGRGGLDSIVTQLLNQMDDTGPPRMEKEDILNLKALNVTEDHVNRSQQCSVCFEDFVLAEVVNELQCQHIFHKDCVVPWLQLHATCPVCRKPLNEAATKHSNNSEDNAGSIPILSSVRRESMDHTAGGSSQHESASTSREGIPSSRTSDTNEENQMQTGNEETRSHQPSPRNPFSSILNQFFGEPTANFPHNLLDQFQFPSFGSSSSAPNSSNTENSQAESTSTTSPESSRERRISAGVNESSDRNIVDGNNNPTGSNPSVNNATRNSTFGSNQPSEDLKDFELD